MMIFDAMCMKCGKRKGIELPETQQAHFAIMQAQMIANFQNCKCGGAVDVQVYDGTIDKDRFAHRAS